MSTPVTVTLNTTPLGSAVPEFRVLDVNRGLVGSRRDVSMPVPGRAGAWRFTEQPGERDITVSGMVIASGTAARRTAMGALGAWADTPDGRVPLVFGDQSDRYWNVMLAGVDVDETRRFPIVELEFVAEPFAWSSSITTATSSISSVSPVSGTFSIDDEVDAYPVIEITPTNGTITAFTMETNDTSITYGTLIADDATITINSLSSTVTLGPNIDSNLTGAYDPDDLSMSDVTGSFPVLIPGTNSWSLTWTGTATTITITRKWRRRYY